MNFGVEAFQNQLVGMARPDVQENKKKCVSHETISKIRLSETQYLVLGFTHE